MSFENQVEAIGEVAGQAFNEALDGELTRCGF